MENLKIASFNIKDNVINNKSERNANIVANLIKDFDLIGTQEFTINSINMVSNNLGDKYKFYGNYRYGKFVKKMPFNETNSIITNKKVISNETIWLPWIADNMSDFKNSIMKMSIMPRIATIVIFETDDQQLNCMINTHLDYQIPSIQIRQLNALKGLIEKYSKYYPIILTGDFNMVIEDVKFDSFVNDIKPILQRVDIKKSTWYGKNGEEVILDHIFVPKSWQIDEVGTVNSVTSDHSFIYTKVLKKY